ALAARQLVGETVEEVLDAEHPGGGVDTSPPSATSSAPSSPAQTTGEGETAAPAAPTKCGKDAPKHGGKGKH
ncbi:hypothetical protein ABZ504_44620, partial [Streptomyces mirabilis]|uniref:hypothetical protein n=1 Tax=Streptomyces mirabilis TaxID=68239 RepID=UPI00347174A4